MQMLDDVLGQFLLRNVNHVIYRTEMMNCLQNMLHSSAANAVKCTFYAVPSFKSSSPRIFPLSG